MGIAAGITVDGFVVGNPNSPQIIGFGITHDDIAWLEMWARFFDDEIFGLSHIRLF